MSSGGIVKILSFGLINFIGRFMIGGALLLGLKMNPTGFAFGALLIAAAFGIAYVLLRFVMKPATVTEALGIAFLWAVIALLLDIATAEPIVHVTIPYLLSEPQTWARLAAILVAAPFTITKQPQTIET